MEPIWIETLQEHLTSIHPFTFINHYLGFFLSAESIRILRGFIFWYGNGKAQLSSADQENEAVWSGIFARVNPWFRQLQLAVWTGSMYHQGHMVKAISHTWLLTVQVALEAAVAVNAGTSRLVSLQNNLTPVLCVQCSIARSSTIISSQAHMITSVRTIPHGCVQSSQRIV
jgi:hypothetical protein